MTLEYRLAENGLQRQSQTRTNTPCSQPLQDPPRHGLAWPAGPWVTWARLVPLGRLVTPSSSSRWSDCSSQTRVLDPASAPGPYLPLRLSPGVFLLVPLCPLWTPQPCVCLTCDEEPPACPRLCCGRGLACPPRASKERTVPNKVALQDATRRRAPSGGG